MRGSAAAASRKCERGVHGEHGVPLVRAGAAQSHARADADVAHEPVDPTHRGLGVRHHRLAGGGVSDVRCEDVGDRTLRLDQCRGEACCLGVDVGTGDGGAGSAGYDRDRSPVAHGPVVLRRGSRASTDDEHLAPVERPHAHAGIFGRPGSGSTPREFKVKATRWYWPTTMQISMSCCSS